MCAIEPYRKRHLIVCKQNSEISCNLVLYCILQKPSLSVLETYKTDILKIADKNNDGKVSRDELALLLSA